MGCTLSDASHFFEISQGLLYNSPYQSLIREMLPASHSIKSMREPYEVLRLFLSYTTQGYQPLYFFFPQVFISTVPTIPRNTTMAAGTQTKTGGRKRMRSDTKAQATTRALVTKRTRRILYFSRSSFDAVLYPEISQSPLPKYITTASDKKTIKMREMRSFILIL